MKKCVTFLFLIPVLLFLYSVDSYAQDKGAEKNVSDIQSGRVEKIPVINDQLREQYTQKDYETFLRKEKNGEIPEQGGMVFSPAAADALVNNNTGAGTVGNFTQSETDIIAFGNTVLIGFNDAGSNSGGASKFTGFSYSNDGGASFMDAGTLPTNAGGDAGDPVLARNETTGRIYFSTLGYVVSTIQVFKSDDGGINWSAPVNGTPGGISEDKQWITVDNFSGPGNGNVYLMSRRFAGTQGIYMFRSTDHGNTFTPSGGVQIVAANQGAFVAVGTDHSVYAFWYAGTTLLMRKSTDQALTFGPTITVVSGLVGGTNGDLGLTGIRQGTSTASAFRSNSFPHAAVNPVSGHIYVTFNDNPVGTDKGDIYYVMSTDGGATWSARTRVNDDITLNDQWQPTIAVTPNGTGIGIFYYSREEDAANNLFKYYGRTGQISGSNIIFTPSFAISDVASLPEFGRDNVINATYMGDYNHAVATASKYHVVWSDNRSDLTGGAGRKDPNVYYEGIVIGPPCPIDPPSNPSPVNGAANIALAGNTASWTNGAGASQMEVWFGEYGNQVQVYNGVPITSLSLAPFEPLEYSTTYQWKIIGKNDTCNVSGSTWSFTTLADPNIVIDSLFCEAFESGLGGWTVTNDGGTASCVWMTRTAPFPNVYTLPPAATGAIMTADVDECGSGATMLSTATLNQSFDLSMYTTMVWIEFDNDWNVLDAQDEAHVEVSTNGGTTWVGVWDKIGTDIRNSHEVVDITTLAAGQTNVKFRLRTVQPGFDWWWVIDNFCIYGKYVLTNTFQLTVNVNNGWNMVSIPGLLPTNQNVGSWWPGKDPSAGVFKFLGGYEPVTTAVPGAGYWMKHNGPNTYNTGDEWPVAGINKVTHSPIAGAAGWNLFGGYEQFVSTAGITTTPPGLQTGSIYEYSGGTYQIASTLVPGYGYWMKLTGAGSINIPSAASGPSKAVANPSTEDFGKIIISDNTQKSFTLLTAEGESDFTQFELPPYPPQGMFDIRFSSQRYAERLGSTPQQIEMTGVQYPVKVKAVGTAIILSDETGKEIARLKDGEEVTLSAAVAKLMVTGNVIPSVYALEQNYPNPFNPSTTIQFSIPEDVQNVKLIIYSSLGEKVAELVNTGLQAGIYKYSWNASDVSSGLYIYQIVTEKFVSTKKMMLLK